MTPDSADDYDAALAAWLGEPAAAKKVEEGDDLFGGRGADTEALERVRVWVQQRFALPEDAAISVAELACKLPGCPPLETVVTFWENGQAHHFKLFKRVREVTFDDLPFAWLKDTLVLPEGFGCECC
jgi:nitrate reductase delta subunit